MGQCVQCNDFFPPHFMVDLKPDMEDSPQKCAFCYLDKKEVTMVFPEDGDREEVISKTDAKKRYQMLLKRLKENKNIQEILEKYNRSPIIKV